MKRDRGIHRAERNFDALMTLLDTDLRTLSELKYHFASMNREVVRIILPRPTVLGIQIEFGNEPHPVVVTSSPQVLKCSCGTSVLKYIGEQDIGGGHSLGLYNCTNCGTTLSKRIYKTGLDVLPSDHVQLGHAEQNETSETKSN